jgi:hypothetical protein
MQALLSLWSSRWRAQLVIGLVALGVATMLSASAILWAMSAHADADLERESQLAAWAANSQIADELQAMSAAMPQHIAGVASLSKAGFKAPADRVAWVERTTALLARIHPLGYTVEVESASTLAVPDTLQAVYVDRGLEVPAFQVNDLTLKVQGLVETELLQLLTQAEAAGGGIVRTEHCKLARRADGAGIDVECRLRRYSLAKPPALPPA